MTDSPNILIAQMRVRRDTRANWVSANPVLALGEFSIVTDEFPTPVRIGVGNVHWNDLQEQYFSLDSSGLNVVGVAEFDTVPPDFNGIWIASKKGRYSAFNIEVPEGKVVAFFPSNKTWVPVDTGIFSYEGARLLKEAYYNPPIIGENGNWYLWNRNTGVFEDSHIPAQGRQGCPGQNAGFGNITAEVNYLGDEETPSVEVTTEGPNTALDIHFTFNLPASTSLRSYISFKKKEYVYSWDGVPQTLEIQSNDIWTLKATYGN